MRLEDLLKTWRIHKIKELVNSLVSPSMLLSLLLFRLALLCSHRSQNNIPE